MHKSSNNKLDYLSDYHNQIFVNNCNEDALKYLESLKTRLNFARFKLNYGWENNSLGDVECFWKQKQKQIIKDLPKPRFTQQDIIDKRPYIPTLNAKHVKSRRSTKTLNRSLSHSIEPKTDLLNFVCNSVNYKRSKRGRRKSHPPSQSQNNYRERHNSLQLSTILCPIDQQPQQQEDWMLNDKKSAIVDTNLRSSFDAAYVPSAINGEPSVVKNSLDYLSYAIAMTEGKKEEDSTSLEEPSLLDEDDWTRTSQLRLSLSIPNQSTDVRNESDSIETNAAAQVMLMFINKDEKDSTNSSFKTASTI
ncbi:uncharacterized protein BX663DRAFT_542136 [Cokeromyces recurvatus]|uniref:uncharacterized protein n=1 Tax=Cokeromyces recurvatus TaxID=90255 RepID=UPI00221FA61B|nr:uncharacterized protein BX663DRAFT_542136 [Cokeromyces recurvatus]KAI7903786.1 hypothetical protein BX663DRAFT_542136 [Cokeromyces recurvatus]